MDNIKTILKSLRKFNRMTQADLAPKLGISRSYLCEIEKGKKPPTLELIESYSKVFDIKPYQILQFAESGNNLKNKVTKFAIKFLEFIQE